uniref:RING-type E3 ubiquitin transferase n=1 Tax=Neogobius melanostomus TaxID=47308 RepID=A0A8C6SID6_9GOBI
MDESSSLLDLLECSVCLERLDTTAKVLPCQHTFCRRCLENILSSRNELRCPECRILQRPQRGTDYIQLLRPLSQTPPQGKALYDFEVKDKDQDKDCLAFSKDSVLTVIRRVDENWAEGMLGDKIGIFPILYVELNETAKQLMEIDKPTTTSGKKNAKKRHSFTALSVTQRAAQLNNRHSMEISNPVLISSSDPRAAARIQVNTQGPDISSNGAKMRPPLAPPPPRQGYLALYAYKPQKADELELRKGEMYRVTEKCQDGWFKGTSLRTAASGVFPGNYVTPVRHSLKLYKLNVHLLLNPQKERKAAALLKLLSGAAAKKKPRSPPSSPPTHDTSLGAVATDPSHPHPHHYHPRSGSSLFFGRYRVVVPYPPQSEAEIELREGDVVFVHKKRDDGWYKGTLQRNGQTGLFPGSFVESF